MAIGLIAKRIRMAAGHYGPPRQIRPCLRIRTPMIASNN
jgi:hypothetical protein